MRRQVRRSFAGGCRVFGRVRVQVQRGLQIEGFRRVEGLSVRARVSVGDTIHSHRTIVRLEIHSRRLRAIRVRGLIRRPDPLWALGVQGFGARVRVRRAEGRKMRDGWFDCRV